MLQNQGDETEPPQVLNGYSLSAQIRYSTVQWARSTKHRTVQPCNHVWTSYRVSQVGPFRWPEQCKSWSQEISMCLHLRFSFHRDVAQKYSILPGRRRTLSQHTRFDGKGWRVSGLVLARRILKKRDESRLYWHWSSHPETVRIWELILYQSLYCSDRSFWCRGTTQWQPDAMGR